MAPLPRNDRVQMPAPGAAPIAREDPESRAYKYENPEVDALSEPVAMVVE